MLVPIFSRPKKGVPDVTVPAKGSPSKRLLNALSNVGLMAGSYRRSILGELQF